MKNLLTTLALILVATLTINAQVDANPKAKTTKIDRLFEKGQIELNAGIGLTSTFTGKNSSMVSVPLTASIDYMVGRNFSVGAMYGSSVTDTDDRILSDGIVASYRNTYQEFGVRMAFHFNKWENFDFYGGTAIAYTKVNLEKKDGEFGELEAQKGIKESNSKVLPLAFVGAKYAFTPRISAFTEVTYGVSLAKVGVSVRLK